MNKRTITLLATMTVLSTSLYVTPAQAASRVYLGGKAVCRQFSLGPGVNAKSIAIKFDSGSSTTVSTSSNWFNVGAYTASVDKMNPRGEWATVTIDCTNAYVPQLSKYTIRRLYAAPKWNNTTGDYNYVVGVDGKVSISN